MGIPTRIKSASMGRSGPVWKPYHPDLARSGKLCERYRGDSQTADVARSFFHTSATLFIKIRANKILNERFNQYLINFSLDLDLVAHYT